MSTRFHVRHRTTYRYGEAMNRGHTVTHLVPRAHPGQRVVSAMVSVLPDPDERFEFTDAFGNHVVQFVIAAPHRVLEVEAESEVDVAPVGVATDDAPWDAPTARTDSSGFVAASLFAHPTRAVAEFAAPCFTPDRPIVDVARDLCSRIHAEFTFDAAFTDVATPLDDVLRARRGVCQDFAHLAVASMRAYGVPARYVSGYVETLPPPGMPKLVGADASHAWCEVALGDGAWFAFDPTNNQAPPERHIVAAVGRDYLDVAPVTGVVVGPVGTQQLFVEVDVTSRPLAREHSPE